MSMYKLLPLWLLLILSGSAWGQTPTLGVPMTEAEIEFWDRSITPDGANLPPGSGSVAEGRELYEAECAICHGPEGEGGGPLVPLTGGIGELDGPKPVKSVGSLWPYATTLFDYLRRAMPFGTQKTMTDSEIYAVTAYTLYLNDIVPEDTRLDRDNLPGIEMPNRFGFFMSDETRHMTGAD